MLGQGGMGVVYKAGNVRLQRPVAIKLLRDGMLEEDKQRFRQEAAYLSRFNHPHIVSVLDYGEEVWSAPRQFSLAGEHWYAEFAKSAPVKKYTVLGWVAGTTLDAVFRRPARPPFCIRVHASSEGEPSSHEHKS